MKKYLMKVLTFSRQGLSNYDGEPEPPFLSDKEFEAMKATDEWKNLQEEGYTEDQIKELLGQMQEGKDNPPPPPPPDEKKESSIVVPEELLGQYSEAEIKALSQLPEDVLQKFFERAINVEKASKSFNKKNQDLAQKRNLFNDEIKSFEEEKQVFEEKKSDLEKAQLTLDNNLKIIMQRIDENEEILAEDPYEQKDVVKQSELIAKQTRAREIKAELERVKENTEKNIELARNNVATTAEVLRRIELFHELQVAFPEELKTTLPVGVILHNFNLGEENVDEVELAKAYRVNEIVEEFLERDIKKPIKEFYKIKKYSLPALPASKKAEENSGDDKNKNAKSIKDVLKEMVEKAKAKPPVNIPSGGSGSPSDKEEKSYVERNGWYI